MTHYERRSMNLWRQIVFAEGDYKCAMSGSHQACEGALEAHHIGGRGNGCIFNPDLGLQFCMKHHKDSQFAPHMNKKLFLFWLEFNYPEKYAVYMELKDKRIPRQDIDMKQVVADLEKRADAAMYRVA